MISEPWVEKIKYHKKLTDANADLMFHIPNTLKSGKVYYDLTGFGGVG